MKIEKLESLKSLFGDRKTIPLITQREAIDRALEYIQGRKQGTITSIKTGLKKLDEYTMDGLEYNKIFSIAALSSHGKSALSKKLRNGIAYLNDNVKQLCFGFEMEAREQIDRTISSDLAFDLKKLYSVSENLSDNDFKLVQTHVNTALKNKDIVYVEETNNVDTIINTIYSYWLQECAEKDLTLVVEIDHILLTKGKDGQSEKSKIDELMEKCNTVKQYIATQGGRILIICLSQMNRGIRGSSELELREPDTEDLFGSSYIEQFSHYIMFQYIPFKLRCNHYTENKYPTYIKYVSNSKKWDSFKVPFIFHHLRKNRSGATPEYPAIYLSNLKHFDITEIPKDEMTEYWVEFRDKGELIRYKD